MQHAHFIQNSKGLRLAYHLDLPEAAHNFPLVVFMSGYRSDMNGTKALDLAQRCAARGQGMLRFDYSGHGQSEGQFEAGCIGDWFRDALFMLDHVVPDGMQCVLVGSSMGGWIASLCAIHRIQRIGGFVGVAAAPHFTEWVADSLTEAQKIVLQRDGFISEPSPYSESPQIFTQKLLQDGARYRLQDHLLLRQDAASLCRRLPVILLQGLNDDDVKWHTSFALRDFFPKADIVLVKGGDHRLSRPCDLDMLDNAVQYMNSTIAAKSTAANFGGFQQGLQQAYLRL